MIIETNNLNFFFGKQQVLDNVSLRVEKGSIYGFLGPNGAGKTTTIKILLNLLPTSNQSISVFGKPLQANRIEILRNTGSLIEQSALYMHMSGYENLKNRANLLKVKPERIVQMLELVGLSGAATKKAGSYSLGMKQRLGIAQALLSDPELLILDEPTNGLDPNGIIEIRNLLKKLTSEHGKTVFVSSHLLAEIERMATHVGIINRGKLVFQGPIDELHALSKAEICVVTANNADAANLLLTKNYQPEIVDNMVVLPFRSDADMAAVNQLLVTNGHTVYSIYRHKKDLEHLFLNITQN